mmetsp:Transcript_15870/g.24418  ORF Transcript_15870/g.24418 Transcript_15870/m.24418 type:complete len:88 (-) Transcript_15870:765-1028(-)
MYREQLVDRSEMIFMRRALIERLTHLLPQSPLFSNHAIYPRRYYDDLMIDEKGYLEFINEQKTRDDFKLSQMKRFNTFVSNSRIGFG